MADAHLTPAARELIRAAARVAVEQMDELLGVLDESAMGPDGRSRVAPDPELRADNIRTTRSNILHWISANVARPGEPVPVNLSAEVVDAERNLVRRGLDRAGGDGYRLGQNAAWLQWMRIVFALADDLDTARDALDVTARTIADFIDETDRAVDALVSAERDELLHGTQAARRDMVDRIVAGDAVTTARAQAVLGYPMDGVHTAGIVWSTAAEPDAAALADAVRAVAGGWGARSVLHVVASAGTVWFWADAAASAVDPHLVPEHVQVAIGATGRGREGFRRSHVGALAVQRMLGRLASQRAVASIQDVALVNAITADTAAADGFVRTVLGALADADRELQLLLRTYLFCQSSVTATAAAAHMHRNTVVRTLARARELLPRPLSEDPIGVAAALDVLYWRG